MARVHKVMLICVLCNVNAAVGARVDKGLLICVLCIVTAVGGGKGT